jgi:branched-chain amino acid transport system substrate-binding protein
MIKKICMLIVCLLAILPSGNALAAAPPIKIGALFAVTGPASFLGEPERNTAQMVVDEITGRAA